MMARLHCPKKGSSSSTRPTWASDPEWMEYTPKEIENLVIKLANEGYSTSEVGIKLRDQYGIPNVKTFLKKSISQIMKDKGLYPDYPEDLLNLMKRAVNLRKHIETNPKDLHNKRGLQLIESKIRRLVKYYKAKKILDTSWRYRYDKAKLIVR